MRRLIVEEPVSQAAVWSWRLAVFALAVGAVAVGLTRFQLVDAPAGLAVFGSAILIACSALLLAGAAAVVVWRTGRGGLGLALGATALACVFLAAPAWPKPCARAKPMPAEEPVTKAKRPSSRNVEAEIMVCE